MSGQEILQWPCLDADGNAAQVKVVQVQFSTKDANGAYQLQASGTPASGYVLDAGRGWGADTHPLLASFKLSINPSLLIQSENQTGVVCSESRVGIVMAWKSDGPGLARGTGEPLEIQPGFPDNSDQITCSLEVEIEKSLVFGALSIWPILYLTKCGQRSKAERFFLATEPGSILGNLVGLQHKVYADGEGGALQVDEVHEGAAMPLWRAGFDWEDPRYDSLDDLSFNITINLDHPLAVSVKGSDPERPYQTAQFNEVVAETMTYFFLKIREQKTAWSDVSEGSELETDSIGQLAHYYLKTYPEIAQSIDRPEKLAESFRKIVAGRSGGLGSK